MDQTIFEPPQWTIKEYYDTLAQPCSLQRLLKVASKCIVALGDWSLVIPTIDLMLLMEEVEWQCQAMFAVTISEPPPPMPDILLSVLLHSSSPFSVSWTSLQHQPQWLSKHIKKSIRSTVLSLDWHPNNILLAAGSADLHCRIFSTYIKEIEDKPGPTAWGTKMPFGELLLEHKDCGGWVHSVSFSPSGDQLAWVAHNSSLTVVDAAQGKEVTQLTTDLLPLLSVLYVNSTDIVAAGHDCCPYLFTYTGPHTLECVKKLDIPKQTSKGSLSAMQHFRNLDKKATEEDNNELETLHQNSIMQLCVVSGEKAKVEKYSSVGLDGAMVIWNFKD